MSHPNSFGIPNGLGSTPTLNPVGQKGPAAIFDTNFRANNFQGNNMSSSNPMQMKKIGSKDPFKDLNKKKKKKRLETFSTYIYKLLRSIHPEIGMSKKSVMIFNSFVEDVFDRFATVASELSHKAGKKTIGSTEIMMAAKLILPGELSKHATGEISKAIKTFTESNSSK